MNCPSCNSLLREKEVINKPHSIYVNECEKCGGWWFDNNKLENYRASVLPTSQYTILPKFEPVSGLNPVLCCHCKEDTLRFYNVGLHVIQRCSKCSGIFLSKVQVLEFVKKEPNYSMLQELLWNLLPW